MRVIDIYQCRHQMAKELEVEFGWVCSNVTRADRRVIGSRDVKLTRRLQQSSP